MTDRAEPAQPVFSAADIGALAHLYRGEVYRSTVWRTRLDATTNWAVVATGIALSVTFSSALASPLPLALVGLLVAVFLSIEARRYRFFDFWRMRAHVLELQFFGPILRGQGIRVDNGWNEILYNDYQYNAAFACASVLCLTALVTLVLKAVVEWRAERALKRAKEAGGIEG